MRLTEILQSKRGRFNVCSMGYKRVWDVLRNAQFAGRGLTALSENYILAQTKVMGFTQIGNLSNQCRQ